MTAPMLVRHAMTRRPIAVTPGERCTDVLHLFQERCIRHAPVVLDGQLVGVVSDRDLLRGVPRLIGQLEADEAAGRAPCCIGDVMTAEPLTCSPNDALDVVAKRLHELRIGCLPVLSEGVLIGMITITDVLRGFTEHLEGEGLQKVAFLFPNARGHAAPNLAALAAKAGVELVALLSSDSDTGARMHLVRTRSEAAAQRAFVELCQAAGLLVVGERAAA